MSLPFSKEIVSCAFLCTYYVCKLFTFPLLILSLSPRQVRPGKRRNWMQQQWQWTLLKRKKNYSLLRERDRAKERTNERKGKRGKPLHTRDEQKMQKEFSGIKGVLIAYLHFWSLLKTPIFPLILGSFLPFS